MLRGVGFIVWRAPRTCRRRYREFTAAAANQKWVADFTYIWTHEGWLFVAVVLDLYSRRVVGWAMHATMTAQLVTDAMLMAIWRRGPSASLLHHSNQGNQYSSEQFQRVVTELGVACSMSRAGNVWDNAVMESFFSTLKIELVVHGSRRSSGADVVHEEPLAGSFAAAVFSSQSSCRVRPLPGRRLRA